MVNKYSDIVTLREQKAAYNIQSESLDDWRTFISNDQFNDILKKIIRSVRNNDADFHKSFWLSGTYGTGKSHAGAVIKHLLCDPVENITDYINEEFNSSKYEFIREDLFNIRKTKRLLPVMLYGRSSIAHKEDLSLNLQSSIMEALNNANIKNITVKTDFDNYISDINNDSDFWDSLIDQNYQLKSIASDRDKLIKNLKEGDCGTVEKIQSALRERGKSINLPLRDISKWFFEVQSQLAENTEYCGLLVIWDEFTDIMASEIGSSILVALQEIDEKIMNSEHNSYFLYISHPSALNSFTPDEQGKTKGRYHYMPYNMETVSAFKIMSKKFILKDKEKYDKITKHFYTKQEGLLNTLSTSSTNIDETKADIRKLFPIHPSTANLAAYYAREAGSSSRSVFQFIGENDKIRDFLNSENIFNNLKTITADFLWDYVLEEFNSNVAKFGAITERFNSRKLQVENEGEDYFAVFKGILLLNALNNIANNETVTPSVQNIKNLFIGTRIENEIDNILVYLDEKSIIQRQPGDLFSILFTALPTKEIELIKEELTLTQFKYTSQIINFGETAKEEFKSILSQIVRPKEFIFYSEDTNSSTLLSKIKTGYDNAKPYKIFMALFFARNTIELNKIKETITNASSNERFENIVFIVFENLFGDKNYNRFIEYQANSSCATKYNLPEQSSAHIDSASKMIKEWISNIRSGNFTYYLNGKIDIKSSKKISETINTYVAPTIFNNGVESLEIIRSANVLTYWKQCSAKQVVNNILTYSSKTDIINNNTGQTKHISYLLQDSVEENLHWKNDIDPNHPLLLVSNFIDKKFKNTDRNQSFNLGDKLIDLTKTPFGLYNSYAGMGMIAFAMRKYIKQIFDLNGKPREAQHLVNDIVEMFKTWESGNKSDKLNFRFESKESRNLCEYLIKIFKLKSLKSYNDISSLTDARWAITHEFSKQKGFPLWSLKYTKDYILPNDFNNLIDNILKICSDSEMRNPSLINETLSGMQKYDFELGNCFNSVDNFKKGFENYLTSINEVKLNANEIEEANNYLTQHLQETIGLWTEDEVSVQLKNWRLNKIQQENITNKNGNSSESFKERLDTEDTPIKHSSQRLYAIDKVKSISNLNQAQKLLESICKVSNDYILDLINNYDV